MGMIQHKGLIVTICIEKNLKMLEKFLNDSNVYYLQSESLTNGYVTFVIPQSGSKVGWEEHNNHVTIIEKIINYIESLNYEDGSNSFDYIEVEYGEFGSKINNCNCRNMY